VTKRPVGQLREEGVTAFLVKRNANQALRAADCGYVLENGRIAMEDNTGRDPSMCGLPGRL